jgi:hypothetical protein
LTAQEGLGAGGGGTRRRRASAAAGSPEVADPAFPWPVWTEAWLWSMSVARVSHWGTQWGAAGLGAWRLWAARSHRRECSGRRQGLRAMETGGKGSRSRGVAHRGCRSDGEAVQGGCRRRPAAAHGGARGRGRCWASLALRSPWFDSWRCCGEATGSGGLQESPAVRNRAADHLPAAALRGNPGRCRCWGRAGWPRGHSWRRDKAAAVFGGD